MPTDFSAAVLPPPPAAVFIVGIGGIGMSALAQFLRWQGYAVAGSDRELTGPGRDELYGKLRSQGIRLFPQDGSGVRELRPALLVYSTAVEEGNPDFTADTAIPRMHRAEALAAALNRTPGRQIGIAGSCGKTSVTGWIAAALKGLGEPVCAVCGGYMNNFITDTMPGNFHASYDCGKESGFMVQGSKAGSTVTPSHRHTATPVPTPWLVYEVDESDGSLVSFRPDVGVVLNIGTDHYDHAKLLELFAVYLGHSKDAGVILDTLAAELVLPPALPVQRFTECAADDESRCGSVAVKRCGGETETPPTPGPTATPSPRHPATPSIIQPVGYAASPEGIRFMLSVPSPTGMQIASPAHGMDEHGQARTTRGRDTATPPRRHTATPVSFSAAQYGRHSATNAAAVVAALLAAGLPFNAESWGKAVAGFRGVARRFDHAGTTKRGIAVFDDYAHNVEKICAAIAAAQEISTPAMGAKNLMCDGVAVEPCGCKTLSSPPGNATVTPPCRHTAAPGLLVIFQPHGYGPFKFMRDPLLGALRAQLRQQDIFAFLPVFYAGGTSTFSPQSDEVCAEYAAAGLRVKNFASKAEAAAFVAAGADGIRTVLVLGARDPALPHWCAALAAL